MSKAKMRAQLMATTENVLAYLKETQDPAVSSTEVADQFDITQQAAYEKLQKMYENGKIGKKKIGARAVVWYLNRDYSLAEVKSET